MRHRLGLTVAGASSPSMKAYSPEVPQHACRWPLRTTPSGTGAIRPRFGRLEVADCSANGSLAAIAALAARVAGSASRATSRCEAGTGTADAAAISLPLLARAAHFAVQPWPDASSPLRDPPRGALRCRTSRKARPTARPPGAIAAGCWRACTRMVRVDRASRSATDDATTCCRRTHRTLLRHRPLPRLSGWCWRDSTG